jgi:hypothetical protein
MRKTDCHRKSQLFAEETRRLAGQVPFIMNAITGIHVPQFECQPGTDSFVPRLNRVSDNFADTLHPDTNLKQRHVSGK